MDPMELHEDLKRKEANEFEDPAVLRELGRMLFLKRTYTVDGIKHHFAASAADTLAALRELLGRREAFLADIALPPSHVLTDPERETIFRQWKDDFHSRDDQY